MREHRQSRRTTLPPGAHAARRQSAAGLSNAALARALRDPARRAITLARLTGTAARSVQRAPTRPVAPAHGKNPADAIKALNAKLRKPSSTNDADKQARDWFAAVRKILGAATSADTGASHTDEIVKNELDELTKEEARLKADFADIRKGKGSLSTYKDALESVAARRLAEISLEFRHNVILRAGQGHTVTKQDGAEVATAGDPMEFNRNELAQLDESLTGTPADATWASGNAVTLGRDDFDVDSHGHPNRRTGGVTSGTADDITIYDTGTERSNWGKVGSGVKYPSYLHVPRHELGHVVQKRLTNAERDELYGTILDWKQYSLAFLSNEQGDPTTPKDRELLRRETGLDDAAVGRFIATVAAPPDSSFHGDRTTRNRRTYFKSAGFLHSVGKPAELPTGPEFDYCYDNQTEYFSELYAFAIGRPQWLASKLLPAQIKWWKEVVFKVPSDPAELKRQMNPPAAVEGDFMTAAATLFTWEQLDAKLAELVKAQQARPAPAATPAQAPAPVP